MSKIPYLFLMDDVMNGKIDPDTIEPRYILVGTGKNFPFDKFIEGINFMAKYGWRPIGYAKYSSRLGINHAECLMEKVE